MKTLLENCLAKSVWKFCLSSSTRLFSKLGLDAPFGKICSNTVFLQPACQQAGKRLLLHLNLMKKFLFPFVKLKWVEETTLGKRTPLKTLLTAKKSQKALPKPEEKWHDPYRWPKQVWGKKQSIWSGTINYGFKKDPDSSTTTNKS